MRRLRALIGLILISILLFAFLAWPSARHEVNVDGGKALKSLTGKKVINPAR